MWQYGDMKRLLCILLGYISISGITEAFTGNISKTSYTFDVDEIFPTPRRLPGGKGIDNVVDYIVSMIPLLTTLMAVGAVLMVIWGGFHMVLGGANTEQTEKGKSIIKDALIGILFGLLAYVIITTL